VEVGIRFQADREWIGQRQLHGGMHAGKAGCVHPQRELARRNIGEAKRTVLIRPRSSVQLDDGDDGTGDRLAGVVCDDGSCEVLWADRPGAAVTLLGENRQGENEDRNES
jgi:glycine/D-amino acid oxidase-like deaminating enzyme